MRFPIQTLRRAVTAPLLMPSTLTATRREQTGKDYWNDPVFEEVEVVSSRCLLRPMSGSEEVVAGGLQANVQAAIDYPVGVELASDMTVEVDGDKYNLSYIAPGSEDHMSERTALVARSG